MDDKILNEFTEFIKLHIDNKGKLNDTSYKTVIDKSIELGIKPLEFNKILKSLANNKEENQIVTKETEPINYINAEKFNKGLDKKTEEKVSIENKPKKKNKAVISIFIFSVIVLILFIKFSFFTKSNEINNSLNIINNSSTNIKKYGNNIFADTPEYLLGYWQGITSEDDLEIQNYKGDLVPNMCSISSNEGILSGSWMTYDVIFNESKDSSDIIYVFKTEQAPGQPKINDYKPRYLFFKIINKTTIYGHKENHHIENLDFTQLDITQKNWRYIGKRNKQEENMNYDDLQSQDIKNEVNLKKYIFITTHYVDDPDGWTNLREIPKGNIIKRLDNKTECKILKSENGWNFIELENGEKGFIHGSRLKKISLSD